MTAVDWSSRESGYSNEVVFSTQGDSTKGGSQDAGSTPAGEFKLTICPNPVQGLPRVHFALPEPTLVNLMLYDTAGQLVWRADLGSYSPGRHQYQPNPEAVSDLTAGVYYLVYQMGNCRNTAKIVLTK